MGGGGGGGGRGGGGENLNTPLIFELSASSASTVATLLTQNMQYKGGFNKPPESLDSPFHHRQPTNLAMTDYLCPKAAMREVKSYLETSHQQNK